MHKLVYTLDGKRHTYLLTIDRVTVGRMEGNDLVLRDHTVSRSHAELRRDGAAWRVTDLGVAARRGRSRPETTTGRRAATRAGRLGLASAT